MCRAPKTANIGPEAPMIVKGQLTVVAPERSHRGGGLFTEHKFATLARVPTARKHKAQSVLVAYSFPVPHCANKARPVPASSLLTPAQPPSSSAPVSLSHWAPR
jgi:hypothetical protein